MDVYEAIKDLPTPYYDDGDGRVIFCGDNCETMHKLPSDCIDLVVTSPPYGSLRQYGGHGWDFEGVANGLWRVVKPGGVVVWVVGDETVDGDETGNSFWQALRFKEIGFRLHDTMIYERPPQYPDTKRYQAAVEFMFVLSVGPPATIHLIADKANTQAGHKISGTERRPDGSLVRRPCEGQLKKKLGIRSNIWRYVTGMNNSTKDKIAFRHPAIFPERLAMDHILSWSNEGDTILDPFNGSGTTTKMAMHNGRQAIGIEIEGRYCEIAANRLRQKVLF